MDAIPVLVPLVGADIDPEWPQCFQGFIRQLPELLRYVLDARRRPLKAAMRPKALSKLDADNFKTAPRWRVIFLLFVSE